MGAAPVPLSYDDLPPGSDIRRERDADGTLRISIPAGDPTPLALKRVWHEALIHSALWSAVILIAMGLIFVWALRLHRVGGISLILAWAGFGVGCGAWVLLLASARYAAESGALRLARLQSTVIGVTAGRLLIEASGPLGAVSRELRFDQIRAVRAGAGLWTDGVQRNLALRYLSIELNDGSFLRLAPGRDRREFAFIAGAISSILGQEVRPA